MVVCYLLERRGLHLASAKVLSSREVKGQSEERHPRTEPDVVGRRFSLRQNKDMEKNKIKSFSAF